MYSMIVASLLNYEQQLVIIKFMTQKKVIHLSQLIITLGVKILVLKWLTKRKKFDILKISSLLSDCTVQREERQPL